MSPPVVVPTRRERRILLPLAVGLNAITIAALAWLDARKILASKYDGESSDTSPHIGSDQDQASTKANTESDPDDAAKFRDKDLTSTDADSNRHTDKVGLDKSSAATPNAEVKAHQLPAAVVGSSA